MHKLLIIGILATTFYSCKKEKTYINFTEIDLVFVNYSKGQTLRFLDTASILQTLVQARYRKEFHEQVGLYGKTGLVTEEYDVSYWKENSGGWSLNVSVSAGSRSLSLQFGSYYNNWLISPDSLPNPIPSLTINGTVYNDVYRLKMYKNNQTLNNNDTASLFQNKQFGVIQMLFPTGKSIIRVD